MCDLLILQVSMFFRAHDTGVVRLCKEALTISSSPLHIQDGVLFTLEYPK